MERKYIEEIQKFICPKCKDEFDDEWDFVDHLEVCMGRQ